MKLNLWQNIYKKILFREDQYMSKDLVKTEINVIDNKIGIMRIGDVDYISLTDLAKYSNPENPANVIIIG